MAHIYSDPTREADAWSLPNVEVFYMEAGAFLAGDGTWMADRISEIVADLPEPMTEAEIDQACNEHAAGLAGWYYWVCFPGCMPDSEPFGPYPTQDAATAAAQDQD